MEKSYTMPIYQKIAIDIANNICNGYIAEGTTLHGRSALAGKYNVSPETIRRSVKILEDLKVVESIKGKGIIVLSRSKAESFLKKYQNITNVSSYKSQLSELLSSRSQLESQILETMNKIVDYSSRLSTINPLVPFEFLIKSNCKLIGQTPGQTNFWQNTGGTIVAIKRGEELIISPGPYIEFLENDILMVIGDTHVNTSVPMFLYEK
ncbi:MULTISPECIES: TrkA C-terminal domain-containing protein [Paraclostridium]|jgi:K+/H+ antiporter YhaU regulatory subunit KhtT|uniref:GntR family transcriptional regulator n=1 Tax=Paraclostridium bifermentans TaxID=1490 RepID=A0AA44DKJ6_PARBF|nr:MULTISPECIES: TrkA C-terminal domain-containing protein [Paraclostridium]KGJ50473.1 GntR family transcriptional regulator [Clostridium sp. NCR]MBN8046738.1 GntR family transcriptional regulator [Paraclostridium bifermentans]MBS5952346.1 GntR family transcriptional regulator [Paraclostridium bifermentans]MBS6507420.1 GntR family transcriptional regulator [Paraclostridium bifermentans]MBU5287740.1 GntR family transcriptional regulator [Paraclostridium bifermentans]